MDKLTDPATSTPPEPATASSPSSELPGSAIEGYLPEVWRVQKDAVYAAIYAVQSGLEYARECLTTHDSALGRTTHKNKTWAETMESDIRHMERTLKLLRAYGPNNPGEPAATGQTKKERLDHE